MNFGTLYRQLRKAKKLSTQEAGRNAGIAPSTINKAELHIQLPRAASMRLMCLKGLKLTETSDEWERLHSAWMSERSGAPIQPRTLAGKMSLEAFKNKEAAEQFFQRVADLKPNEFDEVAKAVARPEVLAALATLNDLYEAKGK